MAANISSFEVDDSVLENLREYSLANSLYWALAEGHACEISARRNAMDVSFFPLDLRIPLYFAQHTDGLTHRTPRRTLVR